MKSNVLTENGKENIVRERNLKNGRSSAKNFMRNAKKQKMTMLKILLMI